MGISSVGVCQSVGAVVMVIIVDSYGLITLHAS